MQGSDGGWGAYDKDNNRVVFNYIPFADHKARCWIPARLILLDGVWKCSALSGYDQTHPSAGPALAFLKKEQEKKDGSYMGGGVLIISMGHGPC